MRGLSQMVPTARSERPETDEKGVALNLDQWVRMRKIVETINNDHPVLAVSTIVDQSDNDARGQLTGKQFLVTDIEIL